MQETTHTVCGHSSARREPGHAVIIVGAGPTGLMLAAELALSGVDVTVVERRLSQVLEGSRGSGLHARSIEVLDQRGIAARFLAQGQLHPAVHFHQVSLPLSDFPSRHNYTLGIWQNDIERILADWVEELSVPVHRGLEVTGLRQDAAGVDVMLADGRALRAQYLVGCDGGRSLVRKSAGIEFPGWDATTSWLIAEVSLSQEPPWGFRHDAVGTHAIGKLDEGRCARVVLVEPELKSGDASLREVQESLIAVYGTDFGVHSPTWLSRFTDMARQAAAYRQGRVLLAGDAAHVHAPVGGQGLNLGLQDAVNLGWKLSQVVNGISPESLLDTYQQERHPVAARVLKTTLAQVALRRADDRTKALNALIAELLHLDEPRKRLAGMLSGLDLRYDFGPGHPLLGCRMPDIELATLKGPVRLFSLLHDCRPVLLNLAEPEAMNIAPWAERVRLIAGKFDGAWQLPVIGEVAAPAAVLIRPDGYVAWVGDGRGTGLVDALSAWFGAAEGRGLA